MEDIYYLSQPIYRGYRLMAKLTAFQAVAMGSSPITRIRIYYIINMLNYIINIYNYLEVKYVSYVNNFFLTIGGVNKTFNLHTKKVTFGGCNSVG